MERLLLDECYVSTRSFGCAGAVNPNPCLGAGLGLRD